MPSLLGIHQRGVTIIGYGSGDHGKYLCDIRVVIKQVYVQATSIHIFKTLKEFNILLRST